jgi:hypothetical protein
MMHSLSIDELCEIIEGPAPPASTNVKTSGKQKKRRKTSKKPDLPQPEAPTTPVIESEPENE